VARKERLLIENSMETVLKFLGSIWTLRYKSSSMYLLFLCAATLPDDVWNGSDDTFELQRDEKLGKMEERRCFTSGCRFSYFPTMLLGWYAKYS